MIADITSGSIFDVDVQSYIITVNLKGVMGKGVALEAKQRYPGVMKNYQHCCHQGLLRIGMLMRYYIGKDKQLILFPTKKDWRNPSELAWVEDGLKKFSSSYKERGITSAVFPPLGAGNGGLDLDTVLDLMRHYLDPIDIPIFIRIKS